MLLLKKQCLIVVVFRALKDPKEAYVTVVSASVTRGITEQPVNALSAKNRVSLKMGYELIFCTALSFFEYCGVCV